MDGTLSDDLLRRMDGYWRAANYLSVGQIYLFDNPLLKQPLEPEHVKPRLLGHWGTTPGQNFIYVHLNRVITQFDLDMIYISGPGHGGPAVVANTYLEGTYSEIYPEISPDAAGLKRLFRQFSFPGGIPSHAAPETPGSIHEGGELGYSLSHAYGAVFDNPELIVACVIGDGEAETGPLAAGWHGNKFVNAKRRCGAADLASQRLQDQQSHDLRPNQPRGTRAVPPRMRPHALFRRGARTGRNAPPDGRRHGRRDRRHSQGQTDARSGGGTVRPRWPMIVLRSPKGWTGPKEVDGLQVEGTWRSHQVPLANPRSNPEHLRLLEAWMCSYRPEELFDSSGRLNADLASLAPVKNRRMGANPHANGGLLLKELQLPDFRQYAVAVTQPGATDAEDTRVFGHFLRDVIRVNEPRATSACSARMKQLPTGSPTYSK